MIGDNGQPTFSVDLAHPAAGGSWIGGERSVWVRVIGGDGAVVMTGSRRVDFRPGPLYQRYAAEGSTGGVFDEYLTVANLLAVPINVSITLHGSETWPAPAGTLTALGPHQCRTFVVSEILGDGAEVAVSLESDHPFYAERAVFFDTYPATAGSAYNRPTPVSLGWPHCPSVERRTSLVLR
jgi:hypothetical protein